MYVPPRNMGSEKEMLEFARVNAFVSFVTAPNGALTATHLPVALVSAPDGGIILYAHMARANPQWKSFDGKVEAMAIFTGPHAYISPFNYQNEVSVPTWNYIAVHMHGKPTLLEAKEEKIEVLRKVIAANDAKYMARFDALPASYLDAMLGGITAFAMKVERMDGRFKLSQEKTDVDRENVIKALLTARPGSAEHDTGVLMQHALEGNKARGAHP